MKYSSKTLERVVQSLSKLPGIGEKSAQRIALYLLEEAGEESRELAEAIMDLTDKVGHCSICFNLTDEDPCIFCRDPNRKRSIICVVEEPRDVLAIEKTQSYNGLYHVLGGLLSPLEGVGREDLHIDELVQRIDKGVEEVILAMNPTVEGEMTAAHLAKILESKNVLVTRIARGIPFGGSLEFNDSVTIAKAIEGRMKI